MTVELEKLKALALAAKDLPDVTQPFVSSTGQVVIGTFSLKDEQLNTVASFYDAATPEAVHELCVEVERLRAVMKQAATGYESGFFASSPRDLDGKFVLHYESPQEAEAAFMALTTEIEAELPSRGRAEGGGTSDKSSEIGGLLGDAKTAETRMSTGFDGGHLGSAPAAGTEKDAERAAFVEAVKAHFAYGDYSFARTADGEYYNAVSTRSYGGRVQPEYAPVSMLWKIWRAAIGAHTKAGTEPE